jgi:ankyrin repeat protein
MRPKDNENDALIQAARIEAARNGALLIQAAKDGDLTRVEDLLKQEVDVNYLNTLNQTALMWAANNKHEEIFTLLLDKTNRTLESTWGVTALMCAVSFGEDQSESTSILSRLLGKIKDDSNEPCKLKDHINKTRRNGDNALIFAARHGAENCVRVLLSKGANVHIQNESGYTALMVAAWRGNYAIAKLLIEHGADLKNTNKDRKTAIDCAVSKDERPTALEILKLAIEKSVEENPSDNEEEERGETKNDTVNTSDTPSPFNCLSEESRKAISNDFFNHAYPALDFIPEEFRDACFVYLLKNPALIEHIKDYNPKIFDIGISVCCKQNIKDRLIEFFDHQSEFFSIPKKSKDACFINLFKDPVHMVFITKFFIKVSKLGHQYQCLKDIFTDMQMYLLKSKTEESDAIHKAKYKFIGLLLDEATNLICLGEKTPDIDNISRRMLAIIIKERSKACENVYEGSFFPVYKCRVEKLVNRLQAFFSNQATLSQPNNNSEQNNIDDNIELKELKK